VKELLPILTLLSLLGADLIVLRYSFNAWTSTTGMVPDWTLANYARFFGDVFFGNIGSRERLDFTDPGSVAERGRKPLHRREARPENCREAGVLFGEWPAAEIRPTEPGRACPVEGVRH